MFDLPNVGVEMGHGVRVAWRDAEALRSRVGEFQGRNLRSLARHSDPQTLVSLCAVLEAIRGAGQEETSFANWGVVASLRSLGQVRFAKVLERNRKTSEMVVPPNVVPHLSLHAGSSSIGLGLGVHGPTFGVSGRPGHVGESLLAGLALLEREPVDGIWVAVSELTGVPFDDAGEPNESLMIVSAALALSRSARGVIELTLQPGRHPDAAVGDLVDWLTGGDVSPWRVGVAGIGIAEMTRREAFVRPAGKAA